MPWYLVTMTYMYVRKRENRGRMNYVELHEQITLLYDTNFPILLLNFYFIILS